MARYQIQICENIEEDNLYVVCVYDKQGDDPDAVIIDYYDVRHISEQSLFELLAQDFDESNIDFDACEIVYDI